MKNIVIAGSGISGLLYALIVSSKERHQNIYIIEKSNELGGLLRAFDYNENGKFDYGMHNFLETGISELDKIIFSMLPDDEWQILDGSKRDLAGVYFNGYLQTHTPYIDLRNLDEETYNKSISDFFLHLNKMANSNINAENTDCSAEEYIVNRFGKIVAKNAIIPSIEKIHKKKADELDFMATVFTPLTRIALFDENIIKELTESKYLSNYIAYTEQRNLPLNRSSGKKGYYPKKYGMYRVIEAIVRELKERGVQFLTNASILEVILNDNMLVENVIVQSQSDKLEFTNIHKLIWTSNVPLIGKLLNFNLSDFKIDKPLKTIVISLILDKKLELNGLYYFFCYDRNFKTYRLNDFNAYCEGAKRNGGYPISIEFLVEESYLLSSPNIEMDAEHELFRFGITQPDTKVLFSKAEILESGFPMPSRNNINAIKSIRNKIKALNISNLELLGILAEDNLFFQTDVLIDTYNKAKNEK